LFSLSASLG
jgi:hypothetical protein